MSRRSARIVIRNRPDVPNFTDDLRRLADWFARCGVKTVVMESTGVYWIPVFEILEQQGFEVMVVNARDAKHVPGRKTDVSDAEWLQRLHEYGLLRASFRRDRARGPLASALSADPARSVGDVPRPRSRGRFADTVTDSVPARAPGGPREIGQSTTLTPRAAAVFQLLHKRNTDGAGIDQQLYRLSGDEAVIPNMTVWNAASVDRETKRSRTGLRAPLAMWRVAPDDPARAASPFANVVHR